MLNRAVILGNAERVEAILGNEETRNLVDVNAYYPVNVDRAVPRKTLKKAAPGLYLIHAAVRGGPDAEGIVTALIKAGADVTLPDKTRNGFTALHYACSDEVARQLIEAGAQADVKDEKRGHTPLIRAAIFGDENIVRVIMVEGGADINLADNDGYTPLHHAASKGNYTIIKLLLEEGATVEPVSRETGCTPLHLAAGGGHRNAVRLLIAQYGASPKTQDKKGKNSLDYALEKGGAIAPDLWAAKRSKNESKVDDEGSKSTASSPKKPEGPLEKKPKATENDDEKGTEEAKLEEDDDEEEE